MSDREVAQWCFTVFILHVIGVIASVLMLLFILQLIEGQNLW